MVKTIKIGKDYEMPPSNMNYNAQPIPSTGRYTKWQSFKLHQEEYEARIIAPLMKTRCRFGGHNNWNDVGLVFCKYCGNREHYVRKRYYCIRCDDRQEKLSHFRNACAWCVLAIWTKELEEGMKS